MKEWFSTFKGALYQGNAIDVLKQLPNESVDLVVTSPPYWGKRDYGDATFTVFGGDPDCEHEWAEQEVGLQHENRNNIRGKQEEVLGKRKTVWIRKYNRRTALVCKKCGAWYGQLGLEPTPQMFVEHLVEIFDEVKRVLKPTGSLFVNIDDTWIGGGSWNNGGGKKYKSNEWERKAVTNASVPSPTTYYSGAKKKSLALVPELFAIKMVYEHGWILREKIIWAKKVLFYKDRVAKGNAMPESVRDRFSHSWEYIFHFTKRQKYYFDWKAVAPEPSELTKLRARYKWRIDPCNKGELYPRSSREINVETAKKIQNGNYKVRPNDVIQINIHPFKDVHFAVYPSEIPEMLIKVASPPNGVVLDPFAGAGTTLVVAEKLGRRWIGIELNPDYCDIIKRRFEKEVNELMKNARLEEWL